MAIVERQVFSVDSTVFGAVPDCDIDVDGAKELAISFQVFESPPGTVVDLGVEAFLVVGSLGLFPLPLASISGDIASSTANGFVFTNGNATHARIAITEALGKTIRLTFPVTTFPATSGTATFKCVVAWRF